MVVVPTSPLPEKVVFWMAVYLVTPAAIVPGLVGVFLSIIQEGVGVVEESPTHVLNNAVLGGLHLSKK